MNSQNRISIYSYSVACKKTAYTMDIPILILMLLSKDIQLIYEQMIREKKTWKNRFGLLNIM